MNPEECSTPRSPRVQVDHRLLDGRAAGPITVMIASDRDALLRAWTARLMQEPDFHAEPLTDPAQLGDGIAQKSPAVLLLDKPMLDRLDGGSVQAIRALFGNTRVLLLWDALCDELIIDVLRYRFHGFLLTNCLLEAGLQSIRAVGRGEFWLSRAALADAIADLLPASPSMVAARPAEPASSTTPLTQRQQQIVALLRCGYTNKEIANQLGVMEDTIKKHLQEVFSKLGVRRRALVALRPNPSAANRI